MSVCGVSVWDYFTPLSQLFPGDFPISHSLISQSVLSLLSPSQNTPSSSLINFIYLGHDSEQSPRIKVVLRSESFQSIQEKLRLDHVGFRLMYSNGRILLKIHEVVISYSFNVFMS